MSNISENKYESLHCESRAPSFSSTETYSEALHPINFLILPSRYPKMTTTPLPTPRALLTSLLRTLTTPPPIQQNSPLVKEHCEPLSNPLKHLSPSQRALLSTMHVLFTPPMLLQALDLLDRRLVLRIVQKEEPQSPILQAKAGTVQEEHPEALHLRSSPPVPAQPDDENGSGFRDSAAGDERDWKGRAGCVLYQVRSSQPPKSRFRDASTGSAGGGGGGGMAYIVRLQAWNCTCAAFTFSSFPPSSVYPQKNAWEPNGGDQDKDGEEEEGEEEALKWGGEGEEEWEFGALSRDGKDGGQVPVCKHVLACVLGERWGLLEGYVKERVVSRGEMAALGSDG
ncbi:hypothetical protein MBM_02289 [Drepanopeziza brunnea f. sp. 'multigermtubi' MB_m1]|uniref:Ubiquitin carboxyl-terminal hydrolase family protein n=1 Tax=Marssonina brunnea f. sp. multigermtubi (strain MB_m1) TaxID=1072389 RepID=K1X238_MARBU|nr:uncharacterized protein MBM_02289 [Drepanopeziza brunnea f. sp. 'multigermtubi' MB_m1]EKD19052.1 hypothetical protein MBM_02289 [Drepanopeziza brunnea f. sp. 'multigermtubi' MB_m1]